VLWKEGPNTSRAREIGGAGEKAKWVRRFEGEGECLGRAGVGLCSLRLALGGGSSSGGKASLQIIVDAPSSPNATHQLNLYSLKSIVNNISIQTIFDV
jgi:hypothetical protein